MSDLLFDILCLKILPKCSENVVNLGKLNFVKVINNNIYINLRLYTLDIKYRVYKQVICFLWLLRLSITQRLLMNNHDSTVDIIYANERIYYLSCNLAGGRTRVSITFIQKSNKYTNTSLLNVHS